MQLQPFSIHCTVSLSTQYFALPGPLKSKPSGQYRYMCLYPLSLFPLTKPLFSSSLTDYLSVSISLSVGLFCVRHAALVGAFALWQIKDCAYCTYNLPQNWQNVWAEVDKVLRILNRLSHPLHATYTTQASSVSLHSLLTISKQGRVLYEPDDWNPFTLQKITIFQPIQAEVAGALV